MDKAINIFLYVIYLFIYGLVGYAVSTTGYTPYKWEWWVCIICILMAYICASSKKYGNVFYSILILGMMILLQFMGFKIEDWQYWICGGAVCFSFVMGTRNLFLDIKARKNK